MLERKKYTNVINFMCDILKRITKFLVSNLKKKKYIRR